MSIVGIGWAAIAAALAAAGDGEPPELTLAQAEAMTSTQLAEALLPSSHPPIVETFVHPIGMEAPASWVTRVDLVSVAGPGDEEGFCSAEHYTVSFASTLPNNPDLGPVPARPSGTTVEAVYRLPSGGQQPSPQSCRSSLSGFFRVTAEDRERKFLLMRLLAAASARAQRRQHLPFAVTFTDTMSDDFDRLARYRPDMTKGHPAARRIADPAAALAAVPLSAVFHIDLRPQDWSFTLKGSDILAKDGSKLSIAQIDAGGEWLVDVAYHGTAIDRLHIVRRIPPPF